MFRAILKSFVRLLLAQRFAGGGASRLNSGAVSTRSFLPAKRWTRCRERNADAFHLDRTFENCSRARGFTLVEALISLALVGLVTGLLANLASEYLGLIKFSKEKTRSALALSSLERMVKEVEQSTALVSPDAPLEVERLEMVRIDTELAQRYQLVDHWYPLASATRVNIVYELSGQDLSRSQSGPSVVSQNEVIAREVSGFATSKLGPRSVKIELSVKEGRTVRTFSSVAYQWVSLDL